MRTDLFNKETVKQITANARAAQEAKSALPNEIKRIERAFNRADFGCAEPHVKEIINALFLLTGHEYTLNNTSTDKPFLFDPGICVVYYRPYGKPPCNEPLLGKPLTDGDILILTDTEGRALLPNGTVTLPDSVLYSNYVIATSRDVDVWYDRAANLTKQEDKE